MEVADVARRLGGVGIEIDASELKSQVEPEGVPVAFTATVERLVDMLCDFMPDMDNVSAIENPQVFFYLQIKSFTDFCFPFFKLIL